MHIDSYQQFKLIWEKISHKFYAKCMGDSGGNWGGQTPLIPVASSLSSKHKLVGEQGCQIGVKIPAHRPPKLAQKQPNLLWSPHIDY